MDDPKAKALFKTSAEAIKGLVSPFSQYEKGEERGLEGTF